MKIKCFFLVNILLFTFHLSSFSQRHPFRYHGEIGGVPTSDNLPFWLRSNQYGKYEKDTYLWGNFNLTYDFKHTDTKKFDYSLGLEGTGTLGHDDNKAFINQAFGRMRWQKLVLNLGIIHRPEMYEGLSATNGDMLYSNNSRNMPGISLSTTDYIIIPWFKKKLAICGIYSEYRMNDKRFAGKKTNLHHKMIALKYTPSSVFNVEVGSEHYVQWGGEIESYGKLPSSFKDYIRVVFFLPGGGNAPSTEGENKLGNHIGSYFLNATYSASNWDITFNYNHMFEDNSGLNFKNFPDGLYGIYLKRNSEPSWIEGILGEFYYTKSQSGRYHSDPETGSTLGGNDNYFNNGIYRSGWTYEGNVIGSPFFTTAAKDGFGRTLGVLNNRFVAYHIGLKGTLPLDITYKALVSFSRNYGIYSNPFFKGEAETHYNQLSVGMEFVLPDTWLPFNTAINLGFDNGKLLDNNFGIMLKIFKSGIF